MGSSGKKKTTMAKLARESRLRERRIDKQARKEDRKAGIGRYSEQPDDSLNGAEPSLAVDGSPGGDANAPAAD